MLQQLAVYCLPAATIVVMIVDVDYYRRTFPPVIIFLPLITTININAVAVDKQIFK